MKARSPEHTEKQAWWQPVVPALGKQRQGWLAQLAEVVSSRGGDRRLVKKEKKEADT